MGYRSALEAAGADVIAYEEFGSWQGDWWARVRHKGEAFWVQGAFGSCTVCDTFQSEFDWDFFDDDADEPLTEEQRQQRLAAFGERYLDDPITDEQAIAQASRDIDWDTDAVAMLAFIQKHSGC